MNSMSDDGKIIAAIPAEAQDGPITVTLESGKQAFSEDIIVVKPILLQWTAPMIIVAGESQMELKGEDLDLVTSVKMGDKEQGFIDCEWTYTVEEGGDTYIKVNIPAQAYSGPIILTSAAGYETKTDLIEVTYNMAVAIQYASPSFGLGQNIVINGSNLMQIEQVYIKGKKVTDFAVRADDTMSFGIPDKLGPGVYRLDLVLIDGTELTWPVPFAASTW